MLQNNVEMDLKMIESSQTQKELAERLGVSLSYVNRIIMPVVII
jgi:DNA-binding CsgD family transcriptional regulator